MRENLSPAVWRHGNRSWIDQTLTRFAVLKMGPALILGWLRFDRTLERTWSHVRRHRQRCARTRSANPCRTQVHRRDEDNRAGGGGHPMSLRHRGVRRANPRFLQYDRLLSACRPCVDIPTPQGLKDTDEANSSEDCRQDRAIRSTPRTKELARSPIARLIWRTRARAGLGDFDEDSRVRANTQKRRGGGGLRARTGGS